MFLSLSKRSLIKFQFLILYAIWSSNCALLASYRSARESPVISCCLFLRSVFGACLVSHTVLSAVSFCCVSLTCVCCLTLLSLFAISLGSLLPPLLVHVSSDVNELRRRECSSSASDRYRHHTSSTSYTLSQQLTGCKVGCSGPFSRCADQIICFFEAK